MNRPVILTSARKNTRNPVSVNPSTPMATGESRQHRKELPGEPGRVRIIHGPANQHRRYCQDLRHKRQSHLLYLGGSLEHRQ